MEEASIPVVVLILSATEADILEGYTRHANCHVIKSLDVDQFSTAAKYIKYSWLTVATLPPWS